MLVTYLVSIYGVIMLYRIDFCHGEGYSKPHYGHGKRLHCCFLENV